MMTTIDKINWSNRKLPKDFILHLDEFKNGCNHQWQIVYQFLPMSCIRCNLCKLKTFVHGL